VVHSRDKDTLLAIIKECWKSYNCLKDEEYVHLTVNHSIRFKDKTTGAHTNSIEGTWSAIKRVVIYIYTSRSKIPFFFFFVEPDTLYVLYNYI
jgi:hypothetical protein